MSTSVQPPWRRFVGLLWLAAAVLLAISCGDPDFGARDAAPGPWGHDEPRPERYAGVELSSRYLEMRDGTRIAVDVLLPAGLEESERLPSLLHQTRYWRSMVFRWPLSAFAERPNPAQYFVRRGYAFVSADVRGSGASFGTRSHPWSEAEVRDAAEIVDWIVAQPWSNGRVGAEGGSYNGTAAELLVTNGHPAVRAAAPRYSLFDAYADMAFPGGVPLPFLTAGWQSANESLDRNELPAVASLLGRLLIAGVRPASPDPRVLAEAVREHAGNANVRDIAATGTYRDDPMPGSGGLTVAAISPSGYGAELEAAAVPLYGWTGWLDGGNSLAAIRRYRSLRVPGSRLILGPWSHGGKWGVSPTSPGRTCFGHQRELIEFFDRHLRGQASPPPVEQPVRYYTMVEDRWKEAADWPPQAVATAYYLGGKGALTRVPPVEDGGSDVYEVDFSVGTGRESRWDTLLGDWPVAYPDRAEQDRRLLVYETVPLDADLEVTGHPRVTVYVASTAADGAFFAYLEDVAPGGSVTYVTEGMLRALHRKLSIEPSPLAGIVPLHSYLRADALPLIPGEVAELRFGLFPTSYLFRRGHRIRLAFAGADRDHFARIPAEGSPRWHVARDRSHPSQLVLPAVSRSAE
jgi:putative CocE/NonD family hydrolase